jgi:hypothetical protein
MDLQESYEPYHFEDVLHSGLRIDQLETGSGPTVAVTIDGMKGSPAILNICGCRPAQQGSNALQSNQALATHVGRVTEIEKQGACPVIIHLACSGNQILEV